LTSATFVTPDQGLSDTQVAERVAAGRTNAVDTRTSRSLADIVRANVFTFFNGLLLSLFAVAIATGRWQNGLFGGVVVANATIGIVQEVRAKRTLDRLALLNAPHARVVRDGSGRDVAVAAVVIDDLLELRTGDQVLADGVVRRSAGLEVDESLLSGESDPVAKAPDDEVRSGSIVVAGQGRFQATAVGNDAYAARLAAEARRFKLTRSELVEGTNRLLRWISVMLVVVGPLVLWSQFRSTDNKTWREAATGTVAALVGMVPEGLVLLTSLAFLLATLSLARRKTLVQELPAVEGLARVDVVCLDKTGTLTYGDVQFDRVDVLGATPEADVHEALGLLCAADDANATSRALAKAFPTSTWRVAAVVPFSSARKWSAVTAQTYGTWVLGAPEMIVPQPSGAAQSTARATAEALAAEGHRVMLLAHSAAPALSHGEATLPGDLVPAALILLAERIREDAAETLRYFTEQGVVLKVISGDSARTVGAIAARVGLPGVSGPDDAVDARTLSDDLDELADVLESHSAFGRVTPQQKRAMVTALRRRGHVVAMTGDGVNDALALKDADIGVAMGNGSPATRAVAQIVLLDGRFAHLPDVVAEGRRVIANIERSSNLFLVKNIYSFVLALITAVTLSAYPLAPIQLTLISTATIGVPGFLLALLPNRRRYVPGFLRRVVRFAIPTGTVIAVAAYLGYRTTRLFESGAGVEEARTTATMVVLIVSLWTLLVLARPLSTWKLGLFVTLVALVTLAVLFPPLAHGVLLLDVTPQRLVVAGAIGAAGAFLVELAHRAVALVTRLVS
jgi:cation-transporting ATPase E